MTETKTVRPDEDVCRLLTAGDYHCAFELLLERYRQKVFHLAFSMLRNAPSAEDLAQDIFLRIWRGLPGYNGRASLSTWIYTISRNTCLTEIRKRSRRPTFSLDAQQEETGIDHLEELQVESPEAGTAMDIEHCLSQISEKYRRVIVLFYLEQKSYEETAALLGMPIGTVKTCLHRAKQALLKVAHRSPLIQTPTPCSS